MHFKVRHTLIYHIWERCGFFFSKKYHIVCSTIEPTQGIIPKVTKLQVEHF